MRGPQRRITSEKILDNVPTPVIAIDRDFKVPAASQQMAAGAAEVVKSVESIGAVAEQSTASAHQMSALAANLQELVVQFKTDNGEVEATVGAAGGPVAETD